MNNKFLKTSTFNLDTNLNFSQIESISRKMAEGERRGEGTVERNVVLFVSQNERHGDEELACAKGIVSSSLFHLLFVVFLGEEQQLEKMNKLQVKRKLCPSLSFFLSLLSSFSLSFFQSSSNFSFLPFFPNINIA